MIGLRRESPRCWTCHLHLLLSHAWLHLDISIFFLRLLRFASGAYSQHCDLLSLLSEAALDALYFTHSLCLPPQQHLKSLRLTVLMQDSQVAVAHMLLLSSNA